MRKQISLACVSLCLISCLAGCTSSGGKSTTQTTTEVTTEATTIVTTTATTTEATTTEATTEEETTEEITTEAPSTVVQSDGAYDAYDNTKYSWWFVRNESHSTPGCQQDFDISQYHAYYANPSPADNTIYLTMDCGYENGYMPQILDTLRDKDVKAIFFVTQHYIETQPELVKRMKDEGHLVGNHTNNHPSMPTLSIAEQRQEIESCAQCMKEMTGYDMDPYFRPPMGEYSQRSLQLMEDMGYCTVFWSIAFLDYDVDNQPSVEYVLDHFNQNIHPGAVPLLHCVSAADTEALPQLIDNLRGQGYRFARIDEFCHF